MCLTTLSYTVAFSFSSSGINTHDSPMFTYNRGPNPCSHLAFMKALSTPKTMLQKHSAKQSSPRNKMMSWEGNTAPQTARVADRQQRGDGYITQNARHFSFARSHSSPLLTGFVKTVQHALRNAILRLRLRLILFVDKFGPLPCRLALALALWFLRTPSRLG